MPYSIKVLMFTCNVSIVFRFNLTSNMAVQSTGNITERLPVAVAVKQTHGQS